jgi:serine/threonine-protein kinase
VAGASTENAPNTEAPLIVDRYAIYDAIASGGMATVHLGRLIGTAGFLRTVAIKRLHSQFAGDPEFTAMFLDEARLASRIQHPNVVATIDVVMKERELLLVMEYVRGESLSKLVRKARDRGERLPPRVVVAIVSEALHGLHAAHEAVDERGTAIGLVHRDMSPQNILVGSDGISRVLDFGVAKAAGRIQTTRDGDIKGKVLYMSPEQLGAQPLTRTTDIYAAGVVLFETLTSVRMFAGENETAALTKIIQNQIRVPSEIDPLLAPFDDIVRRATFADPSYRYSTALEMAAALEAIGSGPASPKDVSACVTQLAGELLDQRAKMVTEIERSSTGSRSPLGSSRGGSEHDLRIPTPAPPSLPSIVSSASLTAIAVASAIVPTPAPRRSLATGTIVLLGMLVAALGVIAILLSRGQGQPSTNASEAPPVAPQSAAPPETATAAVVRRPDDPTILAAAPPSTMPNAPTPSPATSLPANAKDAAPAAAASARKAPTPSKPAPNKVNCDPPYVIDKNGHQHFIPECMK